MKKNSYIHKMFRSVLAALLCILAMLGSKLAHAQVSVVATSGTTGPSVYADLSSAFAAIDSGTHQGDIVIEISTSFTDPAIAQLNGSGAGFALYTSVLVRPVNDGIIISYASPQGRGMIELNGADSITIDGDNPNTAGINRNLTFTNTATPTTTFTSVIRVATSGSIPYIDANSITIKNLIINGSATGRNLTGVTSTTGSENTTFGIIAGPDGGSPVSDIISVTGGMASGAMINNFAIQNCAINQCARAIGFLGSSVTSSSGIIIENNLIGDQSAVLSGPLPYTAPSTTVYTKGIVVQGTNAVTINGNIIKNMLSYVSTPMSAIELAANIGSGTITISNNAINGIVQNANTSNAPRGIQIMNAAGAYLVSGNMIHNIQGNCPSSTQQPAGIQVATTAPSATIEDNKVSKVYNWNTSSWGVNGILLSGGTNITLQNNMVSDILQDLSTSGSFGITYSVYGIRINSGSGHKVYHNTVHLSGTTLGATTATSQSTFAFCLTSITLTGIDVRNNVFSNMISGGGTTVAHASVFLPSGGTGAMNLTLNNNAYFCGGNDSMQGIFQVGATSGAGLYKPQNFNSTTITPANNARAYTRLLNTAGTNDSASMAFNTAAPFTSATDLHIPSGTVTPLESTGATTTLTLDIDGNTRPGPAGSVNGGAMAPDIGADEGDFTPVDLVVDSSNVDQIITSILPGTINQAVLRIKVYTSGFVTPLELTSLKLSTTGSTTATDIDNAHIYYTGADSTFSIAVSFGSAIAAPDGTFYATGSQPLLKGTNYLWLAYDISSGAGLLNVLDGVLDSLVISGVNYAPIDGNPAGNITITNPMSYVSSTAIQNFTAKVGQGSVNNQIIGMQVVTSATGTPVDVTQLDFNVTGTTDTADIKNIKVWYTGTSGTFAAANQFGTTLAVLPGTTIFTVTGTRALTNGTNHFWLTYDIAATAVVGNIVDAEFTSVTIDGSPQIPVETAPAGSREVRLEYCHPTYTYSCSNGDFVNNFSTTGALTNVSYLASGCNNISNSYNYYQSQMIEVKKGAAFTIHYQGSGVYGEGFRIWIDYDQDGVFGTNEMVAGATASINMNHSIVTIPCDALTGVTRLRIRDVYNAQPATACSVEAYGEAEDYDINILDNPVYYEMSTAIQQTGLVAPGDIDRPVLRIPVKVSGCGDAIATIFSFNTAATTNAVSDIVMARLYTTGNSATFNTNELIGTVPSPNGQFNFITADTLINNDTTNYWLVYDLNASATVNNIIDSRLDSIELSGAYYLPIEGNPSGDIAINLPMTYVSSDAIQPATSKIAQGSSNNEIVKVEIVTSATGAPVNLTQLDFNTTGTTDTANIRNIRVWYTGSAGTFNTSAQFGTTLTNLPGNPAFSVSGIQALVNGSNYFWLTYDIDPVAATGNIIDGECTSFVINGSTQTPATAAPIGSRQIRAPYCVPAQSGTVLIKNVTFNTLHNASATPLAPFYRVFAAADSTTTMVSASTTYNLSVTTSANAIVSVWIDYNDDGVFSPTEWQQVATTSPANIASVIPVTIPCGTAEGEIRMRIRSRTSTLLNGPTEACVTFTGGETQDYTITVVNTPVGYNYSTAVQQTGNVAPATNDNPVLRIPVRVNGCGTGTLTSINVSTAGSTSAADIASVKLYSTGNSSVFHTLTQAGSTVFSPGGSFSFVLTDTLLNNDTTNYWLVYDINPGAIFGNSLDASLDSIEVNGTYYTPVTGTPPGSLLIDAPMSYVSSTAIQSSTAKVGQGTGNNHIIGIEVVTSAAGSAINLTQIDFNTTGTTDTANIRNIKLWYTGSSNFFATTTQIGSTLPVLPGTAVFSITGSQTLVNGTNHFWLTYDIDMAAIIGNVVDAECVSLIIEGNLYTPSITAPAGTQEIRADYCEPPFTTGCGDGDFVNNFATAGGITNISNLLSGCNPNANSFIYYPAQTVTVNKGASFTVNYRGSGDWPEGHKVWIDFDQDGIFTNAELVVSSGPSTVAIAATVTVPLAAMEGITRMRIRNVYNGLPGTACSSEAWGETEDYNVYILPAPAPVTYTWNKTSPDSFNLAANWTPARTSPNLNDVLKFDAGVPVTINNTSNNTTGQLIVDNNTTVTFNASSAAMLSVRDSLHLVSGKIITGTNLTLSLGIDTLSTGVLTGSGSIEGKFRRWVNTTVSSYVLPLITGSNNRSTVINFTSAPAQGGTLTAMFVAGGTTTGGLPLTEGAITINKIASSGYWSVTAADGLTGGVYDATITAAGFTGISGYTDLVLLKRTNSTLPWTLAGTHITTSGSNAVPVLSRTGISGFSEFAAGGDSSVNPLPVKLLVFTAEEHSGNVILNWKTSAETNNKGFAIERSYLKGEWEEIGFMKGRNNASLVSNYTFTDFSPFTSQPSPFYYRLKQVDFNGAFTYSDIISISSKQIASDVISCFPNPFSTGFTMNLQQEVNATAQVEITDINGKKVWARQLNLIKGANNIVVTDAEKWQNGVYFIRVLTGNKVSTSKLIKTH